MNDRQLKEWHDVTRPRLVGIGEKWKELHLASASDEELLAGIAKWALRRATTGQQCQPHLRRCQVHRTINCSVSCARALPGPPLHQRPIPLRIESKTMLANADLFEIAQLVRANEDLAWLVAVTPFEVPYGRLEEPRR